VDSSLHGLREHRAGTRDFDPKITLTRPDRTTEVSEADPRAAPSNERCASLYDAIRDMSIYESAMEEERRRNSGDGLSPGP
jgi:hypothetical protein